MLIFPKEYQDALRPVHDFARLRRKKLYLVGGILRDLLIHRRKENPDFDLCVKSGALRLGKLLADKMKAAFVVLDKQHGACRIIKRSGAKIYTFDLTDFRAKPIEEDLKHRDFTINSLAIPLGDVFTKADLTQKLIDQYSGKADLKKKIIRLTGRQSFVEDPLRILRAFSFSSILGFRLHADLVKSARVNKRKLAKVSAERVRDELFKVFDTPLAYQALSAWDKLKIIDVILPEIKPMRGIGQGPYHHLDVWQHTLETVKQLEIVFKQLGKKENIRAYLDQAISGGRRRMALLKFAALLHDVGKPKALRHVKKKIIFHGHERVGLGLTRLISRRLKLSNEECYSLERIVLWHLRPGYLADCRTLTKKARFRYFRDTGSDALAVLLLSLADQRATKGPLTTALSRINHEKTAAKLIAELFKKKAKKAVPLLNGHDIMRKFSLGSSPLVGKVLSELEELQAIGRIRSKEQAFKAARQVIANKK
ncbi:MAG: HD domain-containing protein [Candidatus Omnitrophota bacterium]